MTAQHTARVARSALSILLVLACTGCWTAPKQTPEQESRGLIMMLPGIEGRQWELQYAYAALRDAGIDSAIDIRDWSRPTGSLSNLIDLPGNQSLARKLAGDIYKYSRQHPNCPIDLIGYSGGGGVVILTAEYLPESVRLRYIILAQAALSPNYDLTRALEHVDGQLVNLYCPTDWLVLGLGTQLFGTIDRVKTAAAGKVGFNIERAVPNESMRSKFRQHAWSLNDFGTGHWGTHIGIGIYGWNRRYVATIITGDLEKSE